MSLCKLQQHTICILHEENMTDNRSMDQEILLIVSYVEVLEQIDAIGYN